MNNTTKKLLIFSALVLFLIIFVAPTPAQAFHFEYVYQTNYSTTPAGFLDGIWHGLIAPYSLAVRLFSYISGIFNVDMYAFNNTGWFYNFGFVLGMVWFAPIGWIAAIIAFIAILI